MGPLFSLGLLAAVGALVFSVSFVVARVAGCDIRKSMLISLAFCVGGAIGAVLAGLAGVAILGAGAELRTTAGVATYLGSLVASAVLGGIVLVRLVAMRSNKSLERARER